MSGAHLQMVDIDGWKTIHEAVEGGNLDALVTTTDTVPWLSGDWVSSKTFLTVPSVIVTRVSSKTVLSLHDLDGQTIAVSSPKRLSPLIHAQAPGSEIVQAQSLSSGLELLSQSKVDAYVGNLTVVDRLINKRFVDVLKIAASRHE